VTQKRLRFATHFVLLVVFMAVQWASPHAHFTGTHEHGGDSHQHTAELHAHQLATLHADAIDIGHAELSEAGVLDYDQVSLPIGEKQADSRPFVPVAVILIPAPTDRYRHELSEAPNQLPDLLPAHIGEPRAPPQLA
jgi:hypothetical protein